MSSSESDSEEKDKFRTRVKALKQVAIEINREAEQQRQSLEKNEANFQQTIDRIARSIEGLSNIKNNKFSLSFYIVLATLGLCAMFYFLLF